MGMIIGGQSVAAIAPMTFVNAEVTTPGSAVLTKPSGLAVGRMAFVWVSTTNNGARLVTDSGTEWTRHQTSWGAPYGYNTIMFSKVLTSADVSNIWRVWNSTLGGTHTVTEPVLAAVYEPNGGSVANVRDTTVNPSAQSSLNLTGFALDPLSRGVLAVSVDRDPEKVPTVPTGFTSRVQGNGGSNFRMALADKLSGYGGGDATWTDVNGASGFPEAGYLVEVT